MTDAGETQANPEIRKAWAIRRLGREEVEAALAEASAQGCDELVLLGPGAWTGEQARAGERPGRLVFQVRARCIAMPSFRDLRQLRSLTVVDLAIDDRWAIEIASNLKQLTSLDLKDASPMSGKFYVAISSTPTPRMASAGPSSRRPRICPMSAKPFRPNGLRCGPR